MEVICDSLNYWSYKDAFRLNFVLLLKVSNIFKMRLPISIKLNEFVFQWKPYKKYWDRISKPLFLHKLNDLQKSEVNSNNKKYASHV